MASAEEIKELFDQDRQFRAAHAAGDELVAALSEGRYANRLQPISLAEIAEAVARDPVLSRDPTVVSTIAAAQRTPDLPLKEVLLHLIRHLSEALRAQVELRKQELEYSMTVNGEAFVAVPAITVKKLGEDFVGDVLTRQHFLNGVADQVMYENIQRAADRVQRRLLAGLFAATPATGGENYSSEACRGPGCHVKTFVDEPARPAKRPQDADEPVIR